MLARFDSEGKFESVFKPKPIEISENAKNFFDKTKTWDLSVLKTKQEFENLSKAIGVADDSLKKFLTTEDEAYKTKDLATYTQYLNDHNKTLDFATLKTKAWAFAKNMAINAGIAFASFLVSKGIQVLDDWIHRAEKCKERVDEMMSTFNSSIEEANSHKKSIDDIADRYEELSKGVNNLGENVSLTSDEYEEYNNIVNQIADMFPKMVQGYTDEGNAIIKLKGNVDKLREAYEEEAKAAYNALIAKGEDGDGNDIVKNASDVLNGENFQVGHQDWGNVENIEFLDKLMSATNDIDSMLELWNSSLGTSYREWFEEYAGVGGTVEIEELTPEQLADIKKNAKVMKQQFQAEIDTAVGNVETLANAYLMTNEDYATLDEQSKNAASIIVNNLSADIVSGFTSKEDVGKYVDDIVQMISDNPQAKDALIGLFTMDTTDMPVDRVQNQVNSYIDTIAKILGEDPVKLKVRLGFDDGDIEALKNNVKNKFKGDEFDSKVGELSETDLKIASNLDVPDDSINSWEELIEKITEAKQNVNKMTVSLKNLKSASESISTLSKAFKELSEDGYITTDTITKIKEATGLGEEEWKKYESTLLNAKVGSDEYNRAMSELTYKILENKIGLDKLTEADEDYITAVLRENGLLNAEAVTADITAIALSKLTLQKSLLNKEEIDTSAEAEEILSLANAANASVASIERLAKVVKYLKKAEEAQDKGETNLAEWYRNEAKRYLDSPVEYDKISLDDVDYSGVLSPSTKNKALDNYLKEAESRYKIHQNEKTYIDDLNHALSNLAKTDEERLEITEKINEAYRDSADNTIKDLEHQIDLKKELYGEDYNSIEDLNNIQKVAHDEADRLRKMGYDDNSSEIQALQKTWWDAENSKSDFYSKQHENIIRDIEHARDMALEANPFTDTTSYYKQMQEEYHKEAERLRALDPEKYKEEIQELQKKWWDAQNAIVDWRWENSQNWINQRNAYNDWTLFSDSEIDAWERVVKWLKEEYPNDLDKIKEAEQSLFKARKKEFDKANDFGNTYLESKKTLLQSYYDVTNSIAEAQHEINKELETSKTMYEYLDEETREWLFNQEDYNILSEELYDIQYQADKLQRQYERDLENSTLATVESITSQYEMQYETLMKSYEIAKADLDIAKKKAKLNNVLNERNVRMFINGQWQWVANTEDVANAKAELADAEYAKRVEESGLTQQESINNLTKQQDELGVVVKKFENGVIDLGEAIYLAEQAIGNMPSALASIFNNAKGTSSGSSRGSSSGGVNYSLSQINSMSPEERSKAWHGANEESKYYLHEANKRDLGGSNTYDSATGIWKKKEYATGTRYTDGGLALMGEEGIEAYISSNGHLIPINQPTIGNIGAGGIVFNEEQLTNLRSLWDLSNVKFNTDRSYINRQLQQIDQSQDNRIIIGNMTVDNGTQNGKDLIDALRRYVGNH